MALRAAEMTWVEIDALSRETIGLIPVGSTEAHGPHLPLATDVIIAEAVCSRAAALLEDRGQGAVIFPAVAYGLTDFAKSFAGTLSVSGDAVSNVICELCMAMAGRFAKTAVVNHHLEPAHFKAVRAGVERARLQGARVAYPDHRRSPWAARLGPEFEHGGSHAGSYETSLVMAAAPHLVRGAIREGLSPNLVDLPAMIRAGASDFASCGGPEAYFGEPARATAEEGNRLLTILAEVVVSSLGQP